MLDLLATVLTGGATGIVGSVLGKLFGFLDFWVEEKKANSDHARTLEMLQLQAQLAGEESERELAIAEATAASNIRMASMDHDQGAGKGSRWVINTLRLVRPVLTGSLILLVGIIYFHDPVGRDVIEASVLYMMSSAVLWWFGDRAMRSKK